MCAPLGVLGAIKNPKKAAMGMVLGNVMLNRAKNVPGAPKQKGKWDFDPIDRSISL